MNYWILVDIILIAVFVSCVYLVGRSGLVKTLAFLLACVIAAVGAYHVTQKLWHWGAEKIFTPLTEKILVKVLGDDPEGTLYGYLDTAVTTFETSFDKIKEKLFSKEGGEGATAEEEEKKPLLVTEDGKPAEDSRTSVEKVSALVGKYLSMVLVFWVFFALILALLRVAIDELGFVSRIPIIGFSNQILGIVAGVVLGYLVLAAPVYLIEKLGGSVDLVDLDSTAKLTQSAVINYIMKTLG